MRLLSAGWVVPVAAPPVRDGALLVDGAGDIAAVGPASSLRRAHPDAPVTWLGADSVLLPGLVDAHCHLEWSCFDGVVAPRAFGAWLRAFMPLRARMADAADHDAAALYGAVRALRAGTTTLADSGPTGAGVAALAATGQRGIVHLEAFGTPAADAARAQADAVARGVAALAERAPARVRVGLSPHAPYSVGPHLWRALAAEATLSVRPWATHIAESPDEDGAILTGAGPIVELFAEAGFAAGRWDADDAESVVARLDAHGALRAGLVAAHCVRLAPSDARRLLRAGVNVAHCPRSNVHLMCGTAPIPALIDAGVPVSLGTDSPASGGDYDLRAEARACRALFGDAAPSAARLVAMMTRDAARALGMGDEVGALVPGMRADLLVLRHAGGAGVDDPHELVLDARSRVRAVVIGGRELVGADGIDGVDEVAAMRAGRTIAARLR